MVDQAKPAVRRHRIVSADGVPLAYGEYVPEGEVSATVVLVHGLASSSGQFHEDALYFAGKGFRVLVPDLRGHGLSGTPQGALRQSDFTIAIMARDMLAVLDHADARDVHWVGNSLGGILALWLLGTPETERLRSLALFGTCFSMALPAAVSRAVRLAFVPGAGITGWVTARTTTRSAPGRMAIAAAIRQFDVAAGAAIAANVRRYDFVDNALRYEGPLLVLWGGKDHAVNMGLRGDIGRFADRPLFRRVDLPQGGHCANFDMPEQFRGALEAHWA